MANGGEITQDQKPGMEQAIDLVSADGDAAAMTDGPCLVTYVDNTGLERVHPTTELGEAVRLAESLYNDYSITGAQVFLLHEIEINLRQVERIVLESSAEVA
ncbi:MAG: hypothetical protein ACI8TP_000662 [Acidimicrobiales bacterium]|jgi:hypothetical protein